MAIQLPKYQKQVGVSGATTEQLIDPDVAAAPLRAATQAIGAVTDMGMEFASKLRQHKEQGESARYSADVKTMLPQFIENARADGKLKGIKDEDMFEQAIKPAIDQFYEGQMGQGYSKSVQDVIAKDYEFQHNKYLVEEQGIVLENTITRNNLAKADLAMSMDAEGNTEGANEIWEDLRTTTKPGWVDEQRSIGRYNSYSIMTQALEEQRIDGLIDDDEYFEGLNKIREDAKSSSMRPNHKKTIEIQTNAKILNFKGKRVTNRDKAINQFKKLRDRDEVTAVAIEEMEKLAGPEWSEALESTIDSTLSVKATSDADADKIYTAVKEYQNGGISAGAALKRIEDVKGQHAEMGVYLVGRIAEDQASSNGVVVAYDDNWNGVPSKVTSTTTDFVDNLGFYMANQPEGKRAGYFGQKFIEYDKWRDANPEATEEDYVTWRNELFKKDAQEFISTQTAPQQPATFGIDVGTVEDGYEYLGGDPSLESSWKEL